MQGLRVRGGRIRDLAQVLYCTWPDLFWILQDPADAFSLAEINGVKIGFPGYEQANIEFGQLYESLIVAERPRHFLMKPGFLAELGGFLRDDWNLIGGISKFEAFEQLSVLDRQYAEMHCTVLLSCIDGAYWDVYSIELDKLSTLANELGNVEPVVLRD